MSRNADLPADKLGDRLTELQHTQQNVRFCALVFEKAAKNGLFQAAIGVK
jgi:hypothetical protein